MLALDSASRILQVGLYSGAGVLVGLTTGVALRMFFRDVRREAQAAEAAASEALVTADDAKRIAWDARDTVDTLKA